MKTTTLCFRLNSPKYYSMDESQHHVGPSLVFLGGSRVSRCEARFAFARRG